MSNNKHTLPRAPVQREHRMMHPWVQLTASAVIEGEAKRRGLHPDVLAAQLLYTVAREDLFAAVLDR